jgi:hypothetical protein
MVETWIDVDKPRDEDTYWVVYIMTPVGPKEVYRTMYKRDAFEYLAKLKS